MALIQKLVGGLGNQRFQYAYIKAAALKNKVDFALDLSEYQVYFRPYELEIFAIEKKYADLAQIPYYERRKTKNKFGNFLLTYIKKFLHNPKIHQKEKNLNFDPTFLDFKEGYIEGFFQSEKYFAEFEEKIRKDFTFSKPLSEKSQKIQAQMQSENSVALHIRRGDYLWAFNNNFHGTSSLNYYKQALAYLQKKEKNLTFYFFSDDIPRVKENFSDIQGVFVDRNSGLESRQDMALMASAKHNIIANSTFSRRGAWLNPNPNKIIIAPKQRFLNNKLDSSDIIPTQRIRL